MTAKSKERRSRTRCSVCGNSFAIDAREAGGLVGFDRAFCSSKCLVRYIQSVPKDGVPDRWIDAGIVRVRTPSDFDRSALCYSFLLRTGFRSYYEGRVAEVLVLRYGMRLFYEPFEVEVPIGSKSRIYIPDFFLPEHGVLLEVKGAWLHGGKRKFFEALKRIGEDRLILVPSHLRKSFFKESLDEHSR